MDKAFLVGFIGAPCSGKTTVAARMFAELKDSGHPAEFISEYARKYIAEQKYFAKSYNESMKDLNDSDQYQIAAEQASQEAVMKFVCSPGTIIVTDTSVINSLLYMSNEYRNSERIKKLISKATPQYDLLFLCGLVPTPPLADSNRIHTEAQSIALHNDLESLLQNFAPDREIVRLEGDSQYRLHTALSTTLGRVSKSPDNYT